MKQTTYQLIILDIDGTLYYQKPVRLFMGMELALGMLVSKSIRRQVGIVRKVRSIREDWEDICKVEKLPVSDQSLDLESTQFHYVAQLLGCSKDEVERAITYWMDERPLKYVSFFRDRNLCEKIQKWRDQGVVVAVYSDNLIKGKTKALGVTLDYEFTAYDQGIGCMKPNPTGITHILKVCQVKPEDAIMIGDRMEKDGEAAQGAGIDYNILKRTYFKRKIQGKLKY